ncbi:hypothetical protein LTR46_007634 [Exophiala xenobiotica]|nr:hypothetical protein LTR46_007634 [Exophiala xenobiotica]
MLSLPGAMLTKVKSSAAHLGRAEKAVEDEVEQGPGSSLDNSALLWTSVFCNSRNIDAIREDINTPLVEVYDAVLTESGERESVDDDVRHAESGETKSLIQRFMHDCDTSDVVSPQADTVEDYSFRASLDMLKAESWTGQELPRNAWLGEGGDGWFRPCAEWLTAYDLYKALRKPRFKYGKASETLAAEAACADTNSENHGRVGATTSTTPPPSLPNNPGSETSPQEAADIERRFVFVSDLDAWNIQALAGTAPEHQADALRDAFFKHLGFKSSIEATVSEKGWPIFQLSLHLPYYAWRCTSHPLDDHRRNRNNKPLRQRRDVSLLQPEGKHAYLYEAQISCVVSAIDEWKWVAYGFVDSYFDDENGENSRTYDQDTLNGIHTGPFEYGITEADKPPAKARDFFCKVLRIRLKQISQEWEEVLRNLEKSFSGYYSSHENRRKKPTAQNSADEEAIGKYGKELQDALDWVGRTSSILSELLAMLQKTHTAWRTFKREHLDIFQDRASASRACQLSAIEATFARLEAISQDIESMDKRRRGIQKELQFELNQHSLVVRDQQRKLAEAGNKLAQASLDMAQASKRFSSLMIFPCRVNGSHLFDATWGTTFASILCLLFRHSPVGALSATLPSFAPSKMAQWEHLHPTGVEGLVKAVYSHILNQHIFILSGGANFPSEVGMKRPVTKATIPPAVQEL